MNSTDSTTAGNQVAEATARFMPGFLDTLTRDEKILVLFAIGFLIVIVCAGIGGMICILSGSDHKQSKKHKHRRRHYYADYHGSKAQQATEYVASLGENYYGNPRVMMAPPMSGHSRHVSRSASDSYLSNGGPRRGHGSQYSHRDRRSVHSHGKRKKEEKRQAEKQKQRFELEYGRAYSQAAMYRAERESSRGSNGFANSAYSGGEYTEYIRSPHAKYSNHSMPVEYAPEPHRHLSYGRRF